MEEPHSSEAESAVLGAVLFEPDKIDNIELVSGDFYHSSNAKLWGELSAMRASGKHMDAITIGSWLKDRGTLDRVGGYDRLVELQSDMIVAGHVNSYADEVRKKARLRHVLSVAQEGVRRAVEGVDPTDDLVSALLQESASSGPKSALNSI